MLFSPTNTISFNRYFIFFIVSILIPAFITWASGEEVKDVTAYLFILLFLYLGYKTHTLKIYGLFLYFIFCILYFHSGTFTMRANYMISFLFTCACFLTLNKLNINLEKYSLKKIFFFFLLFLLAFFLSSTITALTYDGRQYIHGFIIAHHFAYVTAFGGYFFIRQKSYLIGVILIMMSMLVGTRSGLLISFIPILYIIYEVFITSSQNKIRNIVLFSIGGTLVAGVLSVYFFSYIESVIHTFDNFTLDIFSIDNEDSRDFTASRSIIWGLAFLKIIGDGIGQNFFIGRGPMSSYEFIENEYGVRIWLHNDFFEILFSLGIIGLLFYLYCIFIYYRQTKDTFFLFMLLIAMFTNGFFTYLPCLYLALHTLSIKLENKKILFK